MQCLRALCKWHIWFPNYLKGGRIVNYLVELIGDLLAEWSFGFRIVQQKYQGLYDCKFSILAKISG